MVVAARHEHRLVRAAGNPLADALVDKPVPYPGRPGPHIHFKVKKGGRELITTQLLIRGHPGNASDNIFNGTRDLIDRELILTDFKPMKNSKIGELTANFDIILGRTPDDGHGAFACHGMAVWGEDVRAFLAAALADRSAAPAA